MQIEYSHVFDIVDNFAPNRNVQSKVIKDSALSDLPRVSIAIPTYKRSTLLKEAIDSALNQDYKGVFEVIVVDNNPERNDETEQCILKFYAKEPRLCYYKNECNIGMFGNWNRLYELAKGEWVVMLHDDDKLFSDAIRVEMAIIEKEQNIDALFPRHTLDSNFQQLSTKFVSYKKLYLSDFELDNFGDVVGPIIKKIKVIELGGFNSSFYPSADYHFWALLSLKSNTFVITDKVLGFYRIDANESGKLETLDGFIRKDKEIMFGAFNSIPRSIIERFLYKGYVRRYLRAFSGSWYSLFAKDKNASDLTVTLKKHSLTLSPLAKYSSYIYMRYRYYLILKTRQIFTVDI